VRPTVSMPWGGGFGLVWNRLMGHPVISLVVISAGVFLTVPISLRLFSHLCLGLASCPFFQVVPPNVFLFSVVNATCPTHLIHHFSFNRNSV
jgi:hypothetical protein